MLGNDNKLNLMAYPYPQTDLGEGCIPVGRQFGFLLVKPSFPSCKIVGISVAPEMRTVVESSLKFKRKN